MKSKFTTELFDKICERIATSKDGLAQICKENDIDASNFYRWINDDEKKEGEEKKGLRLKYARARESQADYMADLIVQVAFDDDDDEKPFVGSNHIQRDRLKVDSLKWIASKLKPKTYGDKVETTVLGDEAKPLTIINLGSGINPNETSIETK